MGAVSNDIKSGNPYSITLHMFISPTDTLMCCSKLIVVLKHHVDNANSTEDKDVLSKTMKSLQYIMRFIVRSRLLFYE